MFQVTVVETLVAAHGLRFADGTREPLHTHDWHIAVTLEGAELDAQELLVDFVALRQRLREILAPLSGVDLGGAPQLANRNPSAEVVALYVATKLRPHLESHIRLVEVEVEEEPGCFARFRPS